MFNNVGSRFHPARDGGALETFGLGITTKGYRINLKDWVAAPRPHPHHRTMVVLVAHLIAPGASQGGSGGGGLGRSGAPPGTGGTGAPCNFIGCNGGAGGSPG